MIVKIKELREGFTPVYKHTTDACCDCFANLKEPLYIENGFTVKIPLLLLKFLLDMKELQRAVVD